MGTAATWNEIATLAKAALPVLGLSVVALYLCYKSGTLHPLRNRLMRLFISRDDIEQGPIRDAISERSAVVSFGMVYGIHLETSSDVEALIGQARTRNIPLHLIGMAGKAFDREAFEVKPGKSPRKLVDATIFTALFVSYLATVCLFAGAFTDDILIRIKATNTLLWVGPDEKDVAARGILRDRHVAFSQKECAELPKPIRIDPVVTDEARYNLSVLCAILTLPAEEKELREALPMQRIAFGGAAALCLMALIGLLRMLVRRDAIRKLERRAHRLNPQAPGALPAPSRREFVVRIGKSFYLRYGKAHGVPADSPTAD